ADPPREVRFLQVTFLQARLQPRDSGFTRQSRARAARPQERRKPRAFATATEEFAATAVPTGIEANSRHIRHEGASCHPDPLLPPRFRRPPCPAKPDSSSSPSSCSRSSATASTANAPATRPPTTRPSLPPAPGAPTRRRRSRARSAASPSGPAPCRRRSEEHTSELQSREKLVC